METRREFIKTASAVSAGAVISPKLFSNPKEVKAKNYPFCVFTKCLQFLDYEQLGVTLADIGFKGAELSVREEGHVLPGNVKTDLPRAVKTLQKSGISVPMMVTGIVSAEDPLTEAILGAASELGIGFYRMGYLGYDPGKTIPENLSVHKKTFEKLEKLTDRYIGEGEEMLKQQYIIDKCREMLSGYLIDMCKKMNYPVKTVIIIFREIAA